MKRALENIRYITFWFLDFLKGSKTRNHLKEISFILNNFNTPKAIQLRENNLNNLLNHAVKTTKYYSKYKNYNTINDFPVINKNSINSHINQLKSTPYKNDKLRHISTSGSTGAVLKVEQDPNKVSRNTADTLYFFKEVGFNIGSQLLFLRNWDDYLKKRKIDAWLQNIVPLEVVDLDDDYIAKVLKTIKADPSNKMWFGYPSGFEDICKYMDKTNSKPINANIKSTIATSEGLNAYTKQSMQKYFNAPVFSRYSNSENGIIAQQCKGTGDNFCINWASYHVEILEFDKDKPAKPGHLGRIIITDLFNYAMPIIRYDTGDIGSIDYKVSPPVFNKIEGRKTDIIFNTKGKTVPALAINTFSLYKGIIQGQFIQEDKKEYLLKLNVNDEFVQEADIIKEFKGLLGQDANIKIEYVKEIPTLSSGKRKITVNNYTKGQ